MVTSKDLDYSFGKMTQPSFTDSKPTIESLEQNVK